MNKGCSVRRAVDIIGKRWTILLLLELYKGRSCKKRYSEIKKSLPEITPRMLSARLKELERMKMISKKVDPKAIPVRCDYRLTQSGKDFIKIIKDIKIWSLKWNVRNEHCKKTDCRDCRL